MEVLAKRIAKTDAARREAAADVPLPASKGALARSVTAARKRREAAKPKANGAPKKKKVAPGKKVKVLNDMKPKKVKVADEAKPEKKPKKAKVEKEAKPEKELKMTAKCITSRAYKHARSNAIQDGVSPDKAMGIGTLAFREAGKWCVAEGIK